MAFQWYIMNSNQPAYRYLAKMYAKMIFLDQLSTEILVSFERVETITIGFCICAAIIYIKCH